jgi:phosphoglycerate kinase
MAKISVKDLDVAGKRILLRVDFNVPIEQKNGEPVITDDKRIRAALPTIDFLLERGARVIICSHLGRPKGKKDPALSLRPVAKALSDLLLRPVAFIDDCVGEKVDSTIAIMKNGDCVVLENLRFYSEEEKNDPEFAKKLAKNAEIFVNDAFGTAHRAHASTEGVTRYVEKSAAGFLMQKELKFLGEELSKPARPFIVILGGAKVSDKVMVIEALMEKADAILIGGAMAYTFAKAHGFEIGKSLCELDKVDLAKRLLEKAKKKGLKFLLPVDNVITKEIKEGAETKVIETDKGISAEWQGVDIGPETVELYKKEIESAKTILWNGPMGVFEIPDFAKGTFAVAEAVAANRNCTSIIGGGDSVKAIKKAKLIDKVTFASTGGGAALEFLEGKVLPGVAALSDK